MFPFKSITFPDIPYKTSFECPELGQIPRSACRSTETQRVWLNDHDLSISFSHMQNFTIRCEYIPPNLKLGDVGKDCMINTA
ncbi:hypothetical protein VN97_g10029 [Penicillium thymicola]|uniref:Uncharacterized protein n=1 Tax=Penicillium thymicola TaxID=293382 RepID=A0AAI9X4B6_PENTH|nr:hypothetical protein VN97_g10029 [Penicillium thymicola]